MANSNDAMSGHSNLYRRVSRLRWQAAILAVVLVFTHQWIEHAYLFFLPKWTHFWTQVVFYGIVGPVLAWIALNSLRDQISETEEAEAQLRRSRDELAKVNQQLQLMLRVEQRLVEADDEEQLTSEMLELPLEVVPALGSTLIRFDRNEEPLAPMHYGDLNPEEFEAWSAHLAARAPAGACEACSARQASMAVPCPILAGTPTDLEAQRVYCLPLHRGDREYGVLNIYLSDRERPTEEEAALLEAMTNAMSLALESQLLRSKEISALHRLQHVHQLEGLEEQLREILTSTVAALELDGGVVYLSQEDALLDRPALVAPKGAPTDEFLRGFAISVRGMEGPWVAGAIDMQEEEAVGSLVAAPLHKEEKWLGSLLFWSRESSALSKRQARIIESVASQAALLVDSHRRFHEIEYHAALAERERLAREIHDALAQTLGYLKLRTAQLGRWMEEGSEARVQEGIADVRRMLDEAYVDAREAIDGLRLDPAEGKDLQSTLDKVYEEFTEISRVELVSSQAPDLVLPPEVRAQLLRIIQEALGNIRKHASAESAWVSWELGEHWLTLRVRDNGCGFDPGDVPLISRHGLRIMKERAELLGADFQIASRIGEGTEVEVRLPLMTLDRKQSRG